MPQLFDSGIFSVQADDGNVGAGWLLNFYASGTTSRIATYPTFADAEALTNPNTNPVVADANGRFPAIWLLDQEYKGILTDDTGVVKLTRDPIGPDSAATVPVNDGVNGAIFTTVQGSIDYLQSKTLSLRDSGATGSDPDGDTDKINAFLSAHAGYEISLSGLTFTVSNIVVPSNTRLIGGTIKRKTGATGCMVQGTSATGVTFEGVTFDGNNTGDTSQLVRFDGASHDFTARNCTFKNSKDSGLAVSGTSARATIEGNTFSSNAQHGFVTDASGGWHQVTGNLARLNGASGILVSADNVSVTDNRCIANGQTVTSQAGILMLSCGYPSVNDNRALSNGTGTYFSHGIQFNSCANGIMQGNISAGNNGSGLDAYISTGTVIDGNQSLNNNPRGIEVDSGSTYTTVTSNTVQGNADVGISVFNTIGANVAGNTVSGNGTLGTATNPLIGTANSPYGIALWGAGNYGNYARVVDNTITGNVGSGSNGVGLYIHASCIGVTVYGNTLTGNTVQATLVNANLAFAGKNTGLYFEQQGSATIASGTTSIAVTFSPNLSFTPTAQDITLTPAQAATNAPGELYPTSVTAAGFTLNCRNNPGSGGLVVGWRARRETF